MDVDLLDQQGNPIDMDALAKEAEKEERKINSNIRNLMGEGEGASAQAESQVDSEDVGTVYSAKDFN